MVEVEAFFLRGSHVLKMEQMLSRAHNAKMKIFPELFHENVFAGC